ncbi:hypothetical protein BEN74_04925 [Acinetobacter sp. WCHAc010034]|nr:hypothetical protein BEN74_04925 [Acinetobacter sp. WCHAc010034]
MRILLDLNENEMPESAVSAYLNRARRLSACKFRIFSAMQKPHAPACGFPAESAEQIQFIC